MVRIGKNKSKQIRVGKLRIGGGAPVVIQSMTKTDTRDVRATIKQIKQLEKSGCELVRVAVKDFESISALKKIKKKIKIPLVADIHFDYRLAIASIENGADKIRLNPGNIHEEAHIQAVAKCAKKRKVPIRIGVNSGSLPFSKTGLYKTALNYIKVLEKVKFYDIIISLKASDVLTTIDAYRKFSRELNYPLHLGVTAAGPVSIGLVKSSIGIGVLLLEGIGDTIRVSLTSDPCEEIIAAKNILQSLNLRSFGPEVISCPTCGRCQVDLNKIVKKIENHITHYASYGNQRFRKEHTSSITKKPFMSVAIMGCEVNGPGEAKEADIGVACGKNSGVIFKKGRIVKRVREKDIVRELLSEFKNPKL